MKTIRAILIDDEQDSIDIMRLMLQRSSFDINILATANNARSAIELIKEHQPDLLFLDIEMPNMNGFKVLEAFEHPGFKVIFVTSYDQYAIRAIKCSALDYLLKPVDDEELNTALLKVRKQLDTRDLRLDSFKEATSKKDPFRQLVISSDRGFIVLPVKDILYARGMGGGYTAFHLSGDQVRVTTQALTYFEELLPKDQFFRVHRSHLVNLAHVESYSRSRNLNLSTKEQLEVAFRRKSDFLRALKKYLSP